MSFLRFENGSNRRIIAVLLSIPFSSPARVSDRSMTLFRYRIPQRFVPNLHRDTGLFHCFLDRTRTIPFSVWDCPINRQTGRRHRCVSLMFLRETYQRMCSCTTFISGAWPAGVSKYFWRAPAGHSHHTSIKNHEKSNRSETGHSLLIYEKVICMR